MPTRRRPLVPASFLVGCSVLLALAGCAVNPSGTQGQAMTSAEFSAKSNADCTDAKLSSLGGAAPYTAQQYQAIQAQLMAVRRKLDALIPPSRL